MTASGGAMAPRLPILFVGTAVEDLGIAQGIQLALDHDAEVELWSEGTFVPSGYAIPSLLDASNRVDFALFVFTPIDVLTSRGRSQPTARGNVVFEMGLFIAALGPERTFLMTPRGTDLEIPTDLVGVTPLTWDPRKSNLSSAIGPACTLMRHQISVHGLRSRP